MGPGSAMQRCALHRVRDTRTGLDKHFGAYEVICPSCQLVAGTLTCAVGQITATSLGRPALLKEGRFAVVTNVGCGMRWTRRPADERCLSRTAKSCGPDTPTLVSSWRRCLRVTPMMVAIKPGSPGRARRKPLKPFARGKLDRSGRTCGDYARVFFCFAREAAGAGQASGFPCALT
jgi:hypothetical protein